MKTPADKLNTTLGKLNTTLGTMSDKEVEEAKVAISEALIEGRESIDDLKRTGRIASDFMRGMDKMTVVLMSLVLKFGRAATMTKISIMAQSVGILLFIAGLLMGYNIAAKMDAIAEQQAKLIERLDTAERDLAGLTQKVGETKDTMNQALEAAPKVVADDVTGKPKLVVQSESEPIPASELKAKSGRSAPSDSAKTRGKVEFDLDF